MTSSRTTKILIVDDNPGDRTLYQHLLSDDPENDYEFFEAGSAIEGLQHLQTRALDCVLLDLHLPDMSGLDFLRAFEERRIRDKPPVIMLTGQGNAELAVEAMQAGASDYLSKNAISTEALVRTISNASEKFVLKIEVQAKHELLQKTNRELTLRNEEIQRFYHQVSHELKTPLTATREFLSILMDGIGGPLTEEQREYLSLAREGCDQLTAHLNDLLDVARSDTGKMTVVPSPGALGAVVLRNVATMQPSAEQAGVQLSAEIVEALPQVLIDERRISQVLMNLIGNALKFTDAEGQVTVKAGLDSHHAGFVRVTVSDTGQGIESEHLERVFDRLYQVENDFKSSSDGLGLGLHICQHLVQQHGGNIFADSTYGQGSQFSFTVPFAERVTTSACEAEIMELSL